MPAPQKLLVFGGTGFLGRHICSWASSTAGWDVTGTHLSTAPQDSRVRWEHCDILDVSVVSRVVDNANATVVVNAAYRQQGPGAIDTCARGAGNVAAAAAAVGARLIHVSTDLVFDGNLGRPYTETDVMCPLSDYGRAKAEGESLVLSQHPSASVVRTSLIYGGSLGPQEELVRRAIRDRDVAFFVDEWRSPVEVNRLAAAIGRLALTDHSGLLHLAGDERLNRLEFARLLAGHLGLDATQLVGRSQDPALGPRAKDVSLDCELSQSMGLTIPGPSTVLT